MKVFIMESFPSFNAGEAGIFYGIFESFKKLGHVNITVLSDMLDLDKKAYGEFATVLPSWPKFMGAYLFSERTPSRLTRLRLMFTFYLRLFTYSFLYRLFGSFFLKLVQDKHWRTFLSADLLIGGHDNKFATYVPLHFAIITMAAKFILKKPIIIYGGSLKPTHPDVTGVQRMITRVCVNMLNLVILREEDSFHALKKIGLTNLETHVTVDLAFQMPACSSTRLKEIFKIEQISSNNKPLIGVSFSKSILHLAFNEKKELNNSQAYKNYIRTMARFIDFLVKSFSAQVLLISHTAGPVRFVDDRIVAGDCFDQVLMKDNVKNITTEYSAMELKGLIGSLDVFVGSRTHSLIAAGSMTVPSLVMALPEMAKVKGILGDHLGLDKWIVDVRNLDYELLVQTFKEVYDNRSNIKIELEECVASIKKVSDKNNELLHKLHLV